MGTDTSISGCVPVESQYGGPIAEPLRDKSVAQSGGSGTGRMAGALVATTWP